MLPSPCLKTLDTIGNCQRLVFTVGVLTNLLKFELNRSSKLRDIIERKKHPVAPWSLEVVCFQMLDFETSNLRSRNQIRGKLLLSRKLRHFRGGCFSQCFVLSTSPHYSYSRKVFVIIVILSNYQ